MAVHAPDWSPPIELTFVPTDHGKIAVVRDDFLRGGTKQRAAVPFLRALCEQGINEFVYASPFSGFAQIALAVSCEAVGAKCVIFAEQDHTTFSASHFTQSISSIADIHLSRNLGSAEAEAIWYSKESDACYKVPLGFNDPMYKNCLREALERQWEILLDKLGYTPSRLWLPIGSGTLADIFHSIVSPNTSLMCVDVRVLPPTDDRIKKVKRLQNVEYFVAQQQFSEAAWYPPPVTSNLFYDAKLWQFIARQAGPKDVWWNVAA